MLTEHYLKAPKCTNETLLHHHPKTPIKDLVFHVVYAKFCPHQTEQHFFSLLVYSFGEPLNYNHSFLFTADRRNRKKTLRAVLLQGLMCSAFEDAPLQTLAVRTLS